jgi:hypothetical protein
MIPFRNWQRTPKLRGNWQLTNWMQFHICWFLNDFAPERATGNWQLATHYLDADSYLLVLRRFGLKWNKPHFN